MSTDPAFVPDPSALRASNDDRERVASVLHRAMGEGRITVAELQDRLDAVYAAKTLAQLEPVTRDLPEHQTLVPVTAGRPTPQRVVGPAVQPTSTFAVAVMSGAERKQDWVVPGQFTAVAVMGGVELDLTEALFSAPEVTITAVAIMGGIEITVPDDVEVQVSGIGLMGGFEQRVRPASGAVRARLRVNGLALMGGVEVHRPEPKELDR